jgi:hypothetical protein
VLNYMLQAVHFVANQGWRFLPDYHFDPATGIWRHRRGLIEPLLRLNDLSYDGQTGELRYPRHNETARESALADYLQEAKQLALEMPASSLGQPQGLSEDFETLRWFDLPAECVVATA